MNVSDQDANKRIQCGFCGVFVTVPAARLKKRAVLSGYRIAARLEVDGPREIYAAGHIRNHDKMAVQVFHSPLVESGEPARRFLAAMDLYMKVHHPNLIRILDAGQSSDRLYFAVWERVKSLSLEDRLCYGGSLDLKSALHLATLTAQILEWLWMQHGLLYGHLSPRRIRIASDKSVTLFNTILTPLVKDQPPVFPVETLMAGMPGFMSPEILSGSGRLDCRSDIYSLGATLYHMLTGTAPFCGLNPQQIQESQEHASLQDPRTLQPDIPGPVVEFLRTTLAFDPSDRPQDWATVLSLLESLKNNSPIPRPAPMANHSILIEIE